MKQLLFLGLLLCTSSLYGQMLSSLFTPPTTAEKNAVLADWAARDVGVYNWTVVGSGIFNGMTVDVISHEVAGLTHYGFVRHPENYDPNLKYPVLVSNHGGTNGVGLGILAAYNQTCYRNYFIVAPSFRGETLRTDALGFGDLLSGGSVSEFDGDVDDVIALLNGTIANYTGADESNISVTGGSRGGCVSYLMSVRDPRIHTGVYFFGATDHMTYPFMQDSIQDILNTSIGKGPFYNTVMNEAVTDYMAGTMTLADARMALLSRSAIHFISGMPTHVQIHHGDMDLAVPVGNSQIMDAALLSNSLPTGNYTYYEYPGGGHGSNMPQSGQRRNDFIWDTSCPDKDMELEIKVILQGPYDSGTALMKDDLRLAGIFPNTDPYGYGEMISNAALLTATGNNALVDWVYVELRPDTSPDAVRFHFPALLQRDGDVVDVDGNTPIMIGNLPAGGYHVAVRHRNHLGVMANLPAFTN